MKRKLREGFDCVVIYETKSSAIVSITENFTKEEMQYIIDTNEKYVDKFNGKILHIQWRNSLHHACTFEKATEIIYDEPKSGTYWKSKQSIVPTIIHKLITNKKEDFPNWKENGYLVMYNKEGNWISTITKETLYETYTEVSNWVGDPL